MLEKPGIPDHLIVSGVQAEYGLKVTQLSFLPLGYDVNTALYHVDKTNGTASFLKLQTDDFSQITMAFHNSFINRGSIQSSFRWNRGSGIIN
jgi:spectinomycin phosphotransferase